MLEDMKLSDVLNERGSRYGEFKCNAALSQNIKAAMKLSHKWSALAPDQCEALEMFAAKISRILTGDPDYADNWDDITGYATLVANRLKTNTPTAS